MLRSGLGAVMVFCRPASHQSRFYLTAHLLDICETGEPHQVAEHSPAIPQSSTPVHALPPTSILRIFSDRAAVTPELVTVDSIGISQ